MKPDSSSRRRVPAFTPVPLRYRSDGWTPKRQADFLGAFAETWSVTLAALRVGKSRESAYRLRGRPGAESFAAAWDAILYQRERYIDWKVTTEGLLHRALHGKLRPILYRGKYVALEQSPDFEAFRQLYARELRRRAPVRRRRRRSQ